MHTTIVSMNITEQDHRCRQHLPMFATIKHSRNSLFLHVTASARHFYIIDEICVRLQVESDMTVKPYESEADREARRKVEEEKRRREEEAKGSNEKFRALDVSQCQGSMRDDQGGRR